jgi:opacity protein-like surface antigen
MKPVSRVALVLAAVAWLLVLANARADAEISLDAYGGYSITGNQSIDVKNGQSFTLNDVDVDNSWVVGGRIGYWFRSLPFLGLALDGSYFRPDFSVLDLKVGDVAPLLMLQIPIPVIKPYLLAGPAVFITEAKDTRGVFGRPGEKDTDYPIGVKAGGGIRLSLLPFLGIFAEYQFTHFSPEYQFEGLGARRKVETDVNTHHIVGGVSLRF